MLDMGADKSTQMKNWGGPKADLQYDVSVCYITLRWNFRTSETIRFSAKNLLTRREYVTFVTLE